MGIYLRRARADAFLVWLKEAGGDAALNAANFRELSKDLGMTRAQVENTVNWLASKDVVQVVGNNGVVVVSVM